MGLPFLLIAWALADQALKLGRDLTATGLMLGAIATGAVAILGVFVYGNVQEHKAKSP
jgi:hypothetical protein